MYPESTRWVVISYLSLPDKRRALKWLIVAMYFWAGILKIMPGSEWLTGGALYGRHPLGLPDALIPWACAYVILLELVLVFGVLSKRRSRFLGSFSQLILFHIASFWVVGWFYPVLMFLLLAIFPIARMWPAAAAKAGQAHSRAESTRRGRRAAGGLIAVFSGAQLIGFAIPGDAAVTGEGRIFALNMFDAPLECRASVAFVSSTGVQVEVPLNAPFLNARLQCDPIVYLGLARHYCRESAQQGGGFNFTLRLESRRAAGARYLPIIDLESFCTTSPKYRLFRHNDWILLPSDVP